MAESDFDRACNRSMYGWDRGVNGLFNDYANGMPISNSYPTISLDGRTHLPGEPEGEFDAYANDLSVTMSPEAHIFRSATVAETSRRVDVRDVEWGPQEVAATADLAAQTIAATVELTPVAEAETTQDEAAAA